MSKPKSSHRVFSREFKAGIVRRMLGGENVSALARELRFSRKDLYVWRDRFLAGGPEAVRAGRREPGRVLPPLGCLGAAPGRDGGTRRHPALGAGPSALRLSPNRGAAASRRLCGEPQKGAAPDARGQSAVPEETRPCAGHDGLAPWLAGGGESCARHGPDRSRPAVGG